MARICFVSCVSLKASVARPASELYVSPLFRKAKEFASNNFDQWYILSAEYGLVHPDVIIEPYTPTHCQDRKLSFLR